MRFCRLVSSCARNGLRCRKKLLEIWKCNTSPYEVMSISAEKLLKPETCGKFSVSVSAKPSSNRSFRSTAHRGRKCRRFVRLTLGPLMLFSSNVNRCFSLRVALQWATNQDTTGLNKELNCKPVVSLAWVS